MKQKLKSKSGYAFGKLDIDDFNQILKILEMKADYCRIKYSRVNLKLKKDSIKITSMDESHVSLVSVVINKNTIHDYKVTKEQEITIQNDDVDRLLKLRTEKIEITPDEILKPGLAQFQVRNNKMVINLQALDSVHGNVYSFKGTKNDTYTDHTPKIDHTAYGVIREDKLKQALDIVSRCSDNVIFKVIKFTKRTILKLESTKNDNDFNFETEFDIAEYSKGRVKTKFKKESKSIFNAEILKEFARRIKGDFNDFEIYLADQKPIKLTYTKPYSEMQIDFWLAPVVTQ